MKTWIGIATIGAAISFGALNVAASPSDVDGMSAFAKKDGGAAVALDDLSAKDGGALFVAPMAKKDGGIETAKDGGLAKGKDGGIEMGKKDGGAF